MKIQRLIFLLLIISLYTIAIPAPAMADGTCLTFLNGGLTDRQLCPKPTPAGESANLKQTFPQQTKGGLVIYPAQQTKTTPKTGPEDWSLAALFLLASVGIFLRKKTNVVVKT